ncbi:MAG: energy transducer TonB [Pseudomonadota bacterium]
MYTALARDAGCDDNINVFADIPDFGAKQINPAVAERSPYGANRKPNWSMIIAIVALHVVTLTALVTFDVIHVAQKPEPLVVDLIAEPPAPPRDKPKPEPVVVVKVQPVVLTPTPIVQTVTPPPPIAATTTPPPPKQVVAAAPQPSGPVTIGDLDEKLLEGNPPRYPLESRRKHEEGTVVLRLLIGTDGRVSDIAVAQSSGFPRLDRAALQAIRSWRWQPTVRDGQPVEIRGLYSMPFTLRA